MFSHIEVMAGLQTDRPHPGKVTHSPLNAVCLSTRFPNDVAPSSCWARRRVPSGGVRPVRDGKRREPP